ncbi:MAG: YggS family pyridoxal phosphate-dependent enzyme [Firmicutes bacterium]|nr:YggS family pyridoxal phosphate-dependent enzyme [Bacillota bacterium]
MEKEDLATRWEKVKERVANAARRSGRDPAEVTVVAVTKTVPPETIRTAVTLGLCELGENRVQEALAKQAVLGRTGLRWHLIGTLQTNKARKAVESFDLIHSLDRWELAEVLVRTAERLGRKVPVLLQVNVAGEASKHGMPPEEVFPFLARLLKWREILVPSGLMTMAPLTEDPEATRPVFRRLAELFRTARAEFGLGPEWHWLSMGMSQDFEVAVEEGANLVRIGTAIFGARP